MPRAPPLCAVLLAWRPIYLSHPQFSLGPAPAAAAHAASWPAGAGGLPGGRRRQPASPVAMVDLDSLLQEDDQGAGGVPQADYARAGADAFAATQELDVAGQPGLPLACLPPLAAAPPPRPPPAPAAGAASAAAAAAAAAAPRPPPPSPAAPADAAAIAPRSHLADGSFKGPNEDFVLAADEHGNEPVEGEEPHIELVVPARINKRLADYQRAGVRFLFRQYACGKGGLLADDMGLGGWLPCSCSALFCPVRRSLWAGAVGIARWLQHAGR